MKYVTWPENILRVSWEPDQLVLFDNRITEHYAVDNYDDAPRRLNRVTVAGDIPAGPDGSQSYSVTGDASYYTRSPRRGPSHPRPASHGRLGSDVHCRGQPRACGCGALAPAGHP